MMRNTLRFALALAAMALLAPAAHAQAQILPPFSTRTYIYRDAQGPGQISITDVGSPDGSDSRLINVTITQNGVSYTGTGYSYALSPNNPQLLLSFMVQDSRGNDYVFEGTLMPGVGVTGSGTYHIQGFTGWTYWWRIEGLLQQ
jgi:hypothetical protein